MKKTPGGIITLHMCTKNDDHMMYSSWDLVLDAGFGLTMKFWGYRRVKSHTPPTSQACDGVQWSSFRTR